MEVADEKEIFITLIICNTHKRREESKPLVNYLVSISNYLSFI